VVAEMENPSWGMVFSKWLTTVVLPLPEGAEKMMTLFKELQSNEDSLLKINSVKKIFMHVHILTKK
jgi:hypothetical protein